MRINRFLAFCGIASRRKCEEYILNGEVSINGKVSTELAAVIDPSKDEVKYKNEVVKAPAENVYYIFHKPKGYITSQSDPHHKKTIYTLLKSISERVFHVGRLDQDSEGLLLLTNDGDLAHKLLHPKYKVSKTYLVTVTGFLNDDSIQKLSKGIPLEEGITNPCEVEIIKREQSVSQFYLTLNQGWKRQIKRMVETVNLRVTYLKRESFATLKLDNLPKGHFRKLSSEEIGSLKDLVELPNLN